MSEVQKGPYEHTKTHMINTEAVTLTMESDSSGTGCGCTAGKDRKSASRTKVTIGPLSVRTEEIFESSHVPEPAPEDDDKAVIVEVINEKLMPMLVQLVQVMTDRPARGYTPPPYPFGGAEGTNVGPIPDAEVVDDADEVAPEAPPKP